MGKSSEVHICAAVEGDLDEVVIRRLISLVGATSARVYGKKGKSVIHNSLAGYNSAAKYQPWLVLVDLDKEYDCAPLLRATWLPHPAPKMCFRIAVPETEAWLLADRRNIARFLSITAANITRNVESLDDPKQTLVNLAARSRSRTIREDMVPRPGSGRITGPAYTSCLFEFVHKYWDPDVAANASRSLKGCIACLHKLVAIN